MSEGTMISKKACIIEWEEECTTKKKKVGEQVVYETKCENRDVNDCKWVQMLYQEFPR